MALRRRRVGWADLACLGGLAAGWVYYLAIIPLIPSLIGTHPVLLEALNGSLPAQIAGGAQSVAVEDGQEPGSAAAAQVAPHGG